MTHAQFLAAFGPAMEAFGSNKFPQVVLERIHKKVDDLTQQEMRLLTELIIDTCDHAPKTHKVAELANVIRGRRNFSGRLHERPVEESVTCGFCFDLGVVRVSETSDPRIEALMLCECKEGHDQTTDLPRWSREWGQLYTRSRCPVSWFKPDQIFRNLDGSVNYDLTTKPKIEYWKAKIMLAQGYWKQLRETALAERDVTPAGAM